MHQKKPSKRSKQPFKRSGYGKAKIQIFMGFVALLFIALGLFHPKLNAQGGYLEVSTPPPPPPVVMEPPRTPVFIPPPMPPFSQPVVVPTDVTTAIPNPTHLVNIGIGTPELGLSPTSSFPRIEDLKGSTDFILVRATEGTNFSKISPYAVSLKDGTILVGVKRPSSTGLVDTILGQIAVSSDADTLISLKDEVIHIMNLDGLGETCRINLTGNAFAQLQTHLFTIKPGFELTASSHALSRKELRPSDGIARRQFQLIGNKHIAINQFSLESVIKGSDLIASLNQADSGSKEKRILADMSKMAAVLNQVHGTYGYSK